MPATSHRILLPALAVGLTLGLSVSTRAQDQPTLDELLDLEPPPAEAQAPQGEPADPEPQDASAAPADADAEAGDPAADRASDALSMEQASGVFEQAVTQMHGVSRRLGRSYDPGLDTQREAQEILRKLDQVIASARAQQSGGGSSSSSSSARQQDPGSQQVPQSQAQAGAAGQPQPGGETAGRGAFAPGGVGPVEPGPRDIEELRKEWGNLPPRLRDELTEGLSEPFSPVYRELTERFYERLGREQP